MVTEPEDEIKSRPQERDHNELERDAAIGDREPRKKLTAYEETKHQAQQNGQQQESADVFVAPKWLKLEAYILDYQSMILRFSMGSHASRRIEAEILEPHGTG